MFFPSMKLTIESRRTPTEIRSRLQSSTDEAGVEGMLVFGVPGEQPFMGKVGETDFKVLLRLGTFVFLGMNWRLRNSFMPVIVGHIRRTKEGTAVDIKMRLSYPVLLFLIVWFAIAGYGFLGGLLAVVTGAGPETAAGAAGMILIGQLTIRIAFYLPAKIAREKLETLFTM